MANIARLKTWNLNETLTSADLNAEFDNILSGTNNGSLDSDNIDQTDTYTWSGNHNFNSLVTHGANLTVGVDDTGHDVQFFGATSGAHLLWDESADTLKMVGGAKIDAQGTVTVGVDDTGYDVKFFGATTGKYMLWDESADTLAVVGTDITLNGTSVVVPFANDANNRIVTGDGSGGLNGEANLTFDGSTLAVTGAQTLSGDLTVNTDALFVDASASWVGIGDTANANMTVGLTINQGANDNEILALKSSDVAHGMTTLAETDTYGVIKKSSATAGGMQLVGYGDAATPGVGAVTLTAVLGGAADTTKTTSGYGIIDMLVGIKNGTGQQIPGANQNMMSIRDAAATARFLFDVEGSAYADVEWTTYDTYDDLATITEMETVLLANELPEQTPRRHAMEATGIIGKNSWHIENGKPKAMVNFSKLAMLHHGALIQVGDRFRAIEETHAQEIAELKGQLNLLMEKN